MRTFIYKRTHKGDPDSRGWFGNEDCMGRLRKSGFDAVVGIGGICGRARAEGISRKLNWIGIGPKTQRNYIRGPLVKFDHFLLFEENGEDFRSIAPTLARRLLRANSARYLFSDEFNEAEQKEINRILKLAEKAPASAKHCTIRERKNGRCPPKPCGSKVSRIACAVFPRRESCALRPIGGSNRFPVSR